MKSPLLVALALLMTVTFAGTADASDPSPHEPISVNCGDPTVKLACDIWCELDVPHIMAGPLDWLIDCATN